MHDISKSSDKAWNASRQIFSILRENELDGYEAMGTLAALLNEFILASSDPKALAERVAAGIKLAVHTTMYEQKSDKEVH